LDFQNNFVGNFVGICVCIHGPIYCCCGFCRFIIYKIDYDVHTYIECTNVLCFRC